MKNVIATTITAALILGFAQLTAAQIALPNQTAQIVAGNPGVYDMRVSGPSEVVLQTYKVYGITPENRANVTATLNNLLSVGGTKLGSIQVAAVAGDKGTSDVLMVSVSAPRETQKGVEEWVNQVNAGHGVIFSPGTYRINYHPQYRLPSELAKIVMIELSNVGVVYSDDKSNLLSFGDQLHLKDFDLDLVRKYDTPQAQYSIELTAVATSGDLNNKIGLYWDAWRDALPQTVGVGATGKRVKTSELDPIGDLRITDFSVAANLNPQALAGFLNYLEASGEAKVIFRKKINLVGTYPASFSDSGLIVKIEPQVIGESAKVLQVSAGLAISGGVSETGLPITEPCSVSTAVSVGKKGSFVLSGLNYITEVKTSAGIPVLGKIPVVGRLGGRQRTIQRENTVTIYGHVTDGPLTQRVQK